MSRKTKCMIMLGLKGLDKQAQASVLGIADSSHSLKPENRLLFDQRETQDSGLSSNGALSSRAPYFPSVMAGMTKYVYASGSLAPRVRCYVRNASGQAISFDMIRYNSVDIPRPIWLGETKITQGLFEAVMGYNPSHFNGRRESFGHRNDFGFKPNRPVENVSWSEIIHFCNRLSAMHGFTPYYRVLSTRLDLALMELASAEKKRDALRKYFGEPDYESTVPSYKQRVDSLEKSPIEAREIARLDFDSTSNGYRLEFEAEWKSVCRAAGFSGKTAKQTERYGYWVHDNQLHTDSIPVAQRLPDRLGFYDIIGSVAEVFSFTKDQLNQNIAQSSYSEGLLKSYKVVQPRFDQFTYVDAKSKDGKLCDMKVDSTIDHQTDSRQYVKHPKHGFRLARNASVDASYNSSDGYSGNKFERLELSEIYGDDEEEEISYDDSSEGYSGNKFERLELPDIYDDDEDEISYDDSSDD